MKNACTIKVAWLMLAFFLAAGNMKVSVAQSPVIEHFTTVDGLPSAAIFDIIQDDLGFIWLATDNGLSRYNGLKFDNFSIEDGLNDLSVIHFSQGRGDTIWCMGFGSTISFISGGEIQSDTLLNEVLAHNFNTYIDNLYRDSIGQYWISTRSGGLYTIDKDYVITKVYGHNFDYGHQYLYFRDFGDGAIISIIDPPEFLQETLPEFYRDGDSYFFLERIGASHLYRNWLKKSHGDYLLSYWKGLYKISDKELVDSLTFDEQIIDLQRDHQGNLWISHFAAGVMKFNRCNLQEPPEVLFNRNTVSRTFQDRDQILWFATTNDGLYRISSFNFLLYANEGGNTQYTVRSVTAGADRVFFSTYNNQVFYIPLWGKDRTTTKFPLSPMENSIHDIYLDQQNVLWVMNSPYMTYNLDGTPIKGTLLPSGLDLLQLKDGRHALHSQFKIHIEDGDSVLNTKKDLDKRILNMLESPAGDLWVGSLSGLYRFEDQEFVAFDRHAELTKERITSLAHMAGRLVIGYGTGQVALMSEDTLLKIRPALNADFGRINVMTSDGDSILWLGTDAGLKRISIKGFEPFEYRIESYHTSDGLPTERINDMLIYHDTLWLGTNRGMVAFVNRHERKISIPPRVFLKRFLVNMEEKDMSKPLVFKSDEHNIRIEFTGLTQKGSQNIIFRYRLIDHDPQRVLTENEFADFPNLRPGAYTFALNAGNMDGIFNDRPLTIDFVIETPFTRTWTFIILMILLILGFMLITLYLVISFIRRRNAMRQNLVLMQQRLLRSQMNPHFVFNSLLAIQSYIYKNEPKEAGRYLSRFARLIRMILNSSRKELITLEEELDYLNYYLDLQKLRFKNAFDYHIEIAENLHPEMVLLPPMLAQPFIENAIEHGLRNLDYKGKIHIRFMCDKSTLVFQVQDNGIGISKSEKMKYGDGPEHESLGQRITTDRLNLLNKTHGLNVTFRIEELHDESGSVRGTSVSFRIRNKNGEYCR